MPSPERRSPSRLDPAQRRRTILAAAGTAFTEQPYADVTIAEIARQSGISLGLIYHYFAGKEDLYCAMLRVRIEGILARQTAVIRALPEAVSQGARVRAAIGVYLDYIAESPGSWSMQFRSPGAEPAGAGAVRLQAREQYIELLRRLLGIASSGPSRYVLTGFFGGLDAACLEWVDGGCQAADRDVLESVLVGALNGALAGSRQPSASASSALDAAAGTTIDDLPATIGWAEELTEEPAQPRSSSE